jgi:hypothetical protein
MTRPLPHNQKNVKATGAIPTLPTPHAAPKARPDVGSQGSHFGTTYQ